MLFLSRAEANAIHLNLRPSDPSQMLADFDQDAQVLTEHHGHKCFSLHCDGKGIAAFEERWLRQVWLNLLTNAIDVTPDSGTVRMFSRITADSWLVTFEDEGPGLPEPQLAEVFNRFTQFASPEHKTRGSGLGLAISRGIVALHGGTIEARNRTDRSGLSVIVALPAVSSLSRRGK